MHNLRLPSPGWVCQRKAAQQGVSHICRRRRAVQQTPRRGRHPRSQESPPPPLGGRADPQQLSAQLALPTSTSSPQGRPTDSCISSLPAASPSPPPGGRLGGTGTSPSPSPSPPHHDAGPANPPMATSGGLSRRRSRRLRRHVALPPVSATAIAAAAARSVGGPTLSTSRCCPSESCRGANGPAAIRVAVAASRPPSQAPALKFRRSSDSSSEAQAAAAGAAAPDFQV
jgi:hypothetical protein